jgi:hypothetical protein
MRVPERAGLIRERAARHPRRLVDDDAAIIAADLGWRPQTVIMLLTDSRIRLEDGTLVETEDAAPTTADRRIAGGLVAVGS